MTEIGECLPERPDLKHDWVPDGDGWECDRCGEYEDDV